MAKVTRYVELDRGDIETRGVTGTAEEVVEFLRSMDRVYPVLCVRKSNGERLSLARAIAELEEGEE